MPFNTSSRILITGGTGSFGRSFIRRVLTKYPNIERLVVYSRDELKQWELQQAFPATTFPQIRYFLGDIRDRDRLILALDRIDTVIHASALKQVPAAEYNPIEYIKTNVLGAENLVLACLSTGVERLVALSTDKAAAPVNLYGATKLCSDKLFVAANNIRGLRDLSFSVVRYGNVMGSRGSVIPYFISQAKTGTIPITDPRMTRFNITLESSVDLVIYALEHACGGEIFVPKIPSYRILDLATAIAPSATHNIVGLRPGEKLHEHMITSADSLTTYSIGPYYVILPPSEAFASSYSNQSWLEQPVDTDFQYSSETNSDFLSVSDLRELISAHVDPTFHPV